MACAGSQSGTAFADDVIRVFMFAGQSNMVGADAHADRIDRFPDFRGAGAAQNDVLYSYIMGDGDQASNGWGPLRPLDSFGPEITFARRVKQNIQSPIAIIKSAVGGTTVAFDWNPDAPDEGVAIVKITHSGAQMPDWNPQGSPESHRDLYLRFIAMVRAAQDDLTQQGHECSVESIYWHTGENDTHFGPYAQNYSKWMKQLTDQTRLDLKLPDLRWFISEQHKDAPWRNMDMVNAGLDEIAVSDPGTMIIKTSHLPRAQHHFGTKGTLQLGEEMADAYLKHR